MQPATTTSSPLSSRRLSQVMVPPVAASPPVSLTGNAIPGVGEQGNVRSASGPLRHPKPLTPSDIHSMLEQEQEAMVNRLSRELSLLRQQTNSVASTASSTSTTLNDAVDTHHASPYIISSTHPTASRRHRSSSSLSSSYIPAVQGSRAGSVSGIAPAREAYLPTARPDPSRTGRSRESSLTSPGQSEAALSASAPHHQTQQVDQQSHPTAGQPHRTSLSQQKTPMSGSISRHDEIAYHRGEVDSLKRENEMLRRRVRELELSVTNLQKQESGSGQTAENNTSSATAEVAQEPSGSGTKD
ncbi:hypothetical protein BO70DRAFT_398933 [Aspergillus heteromorphus CBS 117.55]|uniref:Uncharacterized protein n=1 Tax=Aspergillus heteromorphus CBS 117.55 TaxID=1448321 RepID=A0A317VKI2_9EURO|nr:uncharacterized protein BO70DRAFT_398933 [Aspergillus heteromorphus CBS 117.55]PWY73711.1 hypothetical protein BO70DRAFT_398933 [Aspergillus heteromorphus CBS 117.55]